MAKNKKGKNRDKKKSSVSHLEEETLRLTIEDLKNKIQWRKELSDVIRDDIESYQKVCNEELQDKRDAVNLLEQGIRDQTLIFQKIKAALPDVIELQKKTEENLSLHLATNCLKLKEENESNEKKLQSIRETMQDLESYDVQQVGVKISETVDELKAIDDGDLFQESALDKNLAKTLRLEMQDIFQKKTSIYQDKLKCKVDRNLERIVEETRWWEDSERILLNMKEHLEKNNRTKSAILKNMKKDLKVRRDNFVESSTRLQALKRKVVALEKRTKQLKNELENETQQEKESDYLVSLTENYAENLETRKLDLENYAEDLKENETYNKKIEIDLFNTDKFGHFLLEIIEEALNLIANEVKHSLIKNYEDPSEKKNVLIELDYLFTEATKFIYGHLHQ